MNVRTFQIVQAHAKFKHTFIFFTLFMFITPKRKFIKFSKSAQLNILDKRILELKILKAQFINDILKLFEKIHTFFKSHSSSLSLKANSAFQHYHSSSSVKRSRNLENFIKSSWDSHYAIFNLNEDNVIVIHRNESKHIVVVVKKHQRKVN